MINTLTFEPLSLDQAKYLTCVWSDKNVIKYTDIHTPCTVEQIKDMITDLEGYDVFTVKNKMTVIGIIGCTPDIKKGKNVFNIFFYFCRACWNHGYATDAVEWLICYIKRKYQTFTLYGDIVCENTASEKLLLKNNFRMISEEPYVFESISSVKRIYVLEKM